MSNTMDYDKLLEEFQRRRSEGLGKNSIAGFVLADIDRLIQAVRELREENRTQAESFMKAVGDYQGSEFAAIKLLQQQNAELFNMSLYCRIRCLTKQLSKERDELRVAVTKQRS